MRQPVGTVRRPLWMFCSVLLVAVGCDHAAKQAAVELLSGSGAIEALGGVVRLQLVANEGAFLSLGERLPEPVRSILFIGAVPVMLAVVTWLVLRSHDASLERIVALGLIAGGGLANWIDRVRDDGAVTDFVSLGFGVLRTGIFNVADVAIVAGLVLLLRAGAEGSVASDG